jgi:plasmid replication initiation protein
MIIKNEDNSKLQEYRNYKVFKANELIQKSRFNLQMQEQKIILYLISKIKPEDMELKEQLFEIQDFCNLCGLDSESGGNYAYIKKTLKALRDKSIWITLEDGSEAILAWLDTVIVNKDSGTVKLKISEMMKPYLLFLKERYTQYELLYTLAMKSQYSLRLYELLKSYEYQRIRTFDIEELKLRLSAENYKRFPDFKRYVLDRAIEEINTLSDIDVTYIIIKESRRFAKIEFTMMIIKDINKRLKTWSNIEKIIGVK